MGQTETHADTSYNGWKNYETWVVRLWLDNEEANYQYWRERVLDAWSNAENSEHARSNARVQLAGELEAQLKDEMPETTGLYAALLASAVGNVDVYEIADAMLDDEGFVPMFCEMPEPCLSCGDDLQAGERGYCAYCQEEAER